MNKEQIPHVVNISRLERIQRISFGVAILLGGFGGALIGRMLDHTSANGNFISRIIEPVFGQNPDMTMAVCAYLGITAGVILAMLFNRALQMRAMRTISKAADAALLARLKDQA